MLRNIWGNVANLSHPINMQNAANVPFPFLFFNFFAIVTQELLPNIDKGVLLKSCLYGKLPLGAAQEIGMEF